MNYSKLKTLVESNSIGGTITGSSGGKKMTLKLEGHPPINFSGSSEEDCAKEVEKYFQNNYSKHWTNAVDRMKNLAKEWS